MTYLERELTPEEIGDLSVLEALGPLETPQQSQAIGAQQVAAAQKSLAAGAWNPAKHPRSRGGKFGTTTGGKRAKAAPRSTRSTRSTKRAPGSRALRVGATGAEVRGIQSKVGAKIDGQYGNLTKQAVMRFQRAHGLQVDGLAGAQTIAALQGRKRAALVKAGALSAADRRWLVGLHA